MFLIRSADMVSRREVLRVYRQILQVARSWQAAVEMDTPTERAYIKEETRRLFRKNRDISDPEEIKTCLEEARTRLELALHYGNPYPRPVNVAPDYVVTSKHKRTQLRRTHQSKPVYIHSQDQ